MYEKIYDTRKLLKLQLENEEITKEEYEFIDFFWNSVRSDYLSKLKVRSLWIPHIGEFIIKKKQLDTYILKRIIRLRYLRKREKTTDSVVEELKNALIIRNEIAIERYNNTKSNRLLYGKYKMENIPKKIKEKIV